MSIAPPPLAATAADRLRQIAVIGALAATLYLNYLSAALPLNGRTPGEISDSFPSLVTPAGYVFSIWGVIYLALIAFAVYQAQPGRGADPTLRGVGWPFVLTCVFNCAWIFLFHYGYYLATEFAMIGLLVTLIAIYVRLGTGQTPPAGRAEAWLVRLPFSLYLAWITIATIANTAIVLLDAGWGRWGLSAEFWAVLVLVVGGAINAAVARTRRDAAYVAVFVWAYAGIIVRQAPNYPVVVTAGLMVPLVVLALVTAPRPEGTAERAETTPA